MTIRAVRLIAAANNQTAQGGNMLCPSWKVAKTDTKAPKRTSAF
jgi:hypothetical protein